MTEPVPGSAHSRRFGEQNYREAEPLFLAGCGLPAAWAGQPQWRVLETSFGRGQNFLATWHAWRQDAARPQLLHYVATEACPDSAQALLQHGSQHPHWLPLAQELAAQCWGLLPGVHRLRLDGGRVLLTLLIGDTQAMLRQQDMAVDSIYLGGSSPASHPEMWSLHTLKALARSAQRGTRLVSCSNAPQVRKDLAQCGFVFADSPEQETLQATFEPAWEPRKAPLWPRGGQAQAPAALAPPRRAVVIGAGIAGAACAQQLAMRGGQVSVLDAAPQPAAGASALPAGIFAPHTSSDDSVLSRITRAGLRSTGQWAQNLLQHGQDWAMTGVLERRQLATPQDETAAHSEASAQTNSEQRRHGAHERPASWNAELAEAAAAWSLPADDYVLKAQQLPADDTALWHANGGWLRPSALVKALLAQADIRFIGNAAVARIAPLAGSQAWSIQNEAGQELAQAELVVFAAGPQSAALAQAVQSDAALLPLRLQAIRGQVSWGMAPDDANLPQHPVNGHGSWIPHFPALNSGAAAWVMGSSFERDVTELPPSSADQARAHAANWAKLQTLLPLTSQHYAQPFAAAQTWAQVRCASNDRLPLVGPLLAEAELPPGRLSPWVCTAMGSRGLTWALLCAELLAARLHGEPLPLPNALAKALSVDRLA